MNNRLLKICNFLAEIEKLKLIERINVLSDGMTRENDSGHSWHLAMMLLVLKKELGIKFNVDHAIKLALVHDLVEIYTGDIVCTDFEKKAEKRKLEQQSADRIFGLLPNSLKDEICNLWLEYDLGKTVEAEVVKSLDKICYIIHYSISGKIIWPPEEEDTKEERREYAHRYSSHNDTLVLILDYFLEELDHRKFGYKKDISLSKRLKKILDFIVEIEKFKLVGRIPCLSDQKTKESDADHSWHLAMMILTLRDELDVNFNLNKSLKLALIHDFGEIYEGDGWAYSKEKKAAKDKYELESAKRLFGMLPKDLEEEFFTYWQEYEENETIEAKVVKGLDKVCYPLQYSTSYTIAYDEKEPAKEESRRYALPSMKFNSVVIQLYDFYMDKVWAKENRKQIRK